jgi:hypothetical protein
LVEVIFFVVILVFAGFVLGSLTGEWRKDRRAQKLLASREPLSAEAFSAQAYPDSARKAEAARRVRGVLERHANTSMAGLRLTDRLADDLHLDLIADPDFFFALDEEFGFDTPVHDFERLSALVERLRTVADLVGYVDGQQWSR